MTPASELERLLDDDRWIRRLARGLVADAGTAEDLAQETWVAALESHRAGEHGAPRAWLGRVLRNAWKDGLRGNARRARREESVARAEATPGADELVAELELRERVARALRELEEPFRSALVRRFFRDESLSTIARRENVAVSTIHERIERGLARLRTRLDAEHGGERGAWGMAMLALARRPGGLIGPVEVVTMAAGLKVAVGVAVLAGAAAWWWTGTERADGLEPAPALAAQQEARAGISARERLLEPQDVREALPRTPVPADSLALAPEDPLVGRVVTSAGQGVSGVEIVRKSPRAEVGRTTSAFDGSFRFGVPAGEAPGRLSCADPRYVTLVAGAPRGDEHLVIVEPTCDFAGEVVDEAGTPIAGASLVFHLRPSLFPGLGMQVWRAAEGEGWKTSSDAAGRFALAGLAGGAHVGLEVRALGFQERDVDLLDTGDARMSIVLARDTRVLEIVGRVLGPDQRPFAGARVSAGHEIVNSAQDGSFVLSSHSQTGRSVRDEDGVWRPETVATVRVFALAPGLAPALQEFARADPPGEIVLVLGSESLSIAGRVLDPAGEPIPGVILWPRALSPFGRVPRGLEGMDRELTVEEELCGTSGGTLGMVTDADGSFELGCLLDQPYDLELFDSRTARRTSRERIAAGTRGLEIVLTPEPGTRRVAGRVLSAGGEPRTGVMIKPRRTGGTNRQPPQLVGGEYWRETDAEGRFEFEALATAGTTLDIHAAPWHMVELEDCADLERIEIVLPLLCELQVVLTDPGLADVLSVLDEHGAELEVLERIHMEGRSLAFSEGARADITAGRSSVIQAPETTRTLVLFKQGVEVLRRPLTLDPHQPTVIRP